MRLRERRAVPPARRLRVRPRKHGARRLLAAVLCSTATCGPKIAARARSACPGPTTAARSGTRLAARRSLPTPCRPGTPAPSRAARCRASTTASPAPCAGASIETLQGTCSRVLRRACACRARPAPRRRIHEVQRRLRARVRHPLRSAAGRPVPRRRGLPQHAGRWWLLLPAAHGRPRRGSSQHCDDAGVPALAALPPAGSLGACEAEDCCTDLCDLGDPGADAQCAAIAPTQACVPVAPGEAPMGSEPWACAPCPCEPRERPSPRRWCPVVAHLRVARGNPCAR